MAWLSKYIHFTGEIIIHPYPNFNDSLSITRWLYIRKYIWKTVTKIIVENKYQFAMLFTQMYNAVMMIAVVETFW